MLISTTVILLSSLALSVLSHPAQPWYPQKQGKSLQLVAKALTSDTLQYHFYIWPQGTAVDVCNTTPIEAHGGFTDGVEYADINDTPFLQDEVSGKFDGGDCKWVNNAIDSPGQLSCASWGVGVEVDCKAEVEKGHVTHNDCWDGETYQRVVYCEW